jgi:benzoylformate decarboxylase
MPSVRDVTFEVLRRHGLTTIFGNPGSNELAFLEGMPKDFRYILGLQEAVVTAMADGYSMATGKPVLINLHAAAGTGNAMGALTNARNSHSPLVITAGQQARAQIGVEALLANADAVMLPRPLVKWSGEPATAEDAPRTLTQAIHIADSDPKGPVYVSIPYDDWSKDVGPLGEYLADRTVTAAKSPSAEQVDELVSRLGAAKSPVIVLGADVDAVRANDLAVALAERLAAPVWIGPSASRCPFPTTHPNFRGVLPASIRGIATQLADHDLILVVGAPVFRYHQFEPGEFLPPGAGLIHITVDPDEAARAPMGDAIIAGIRETLTAILESLAPTDRAPAVARSLPEPVLTGSTPLPPATVFDVIRSVSPADAIIVKESTSTTAIFWDHADLAQPGSYFFPSAGGLGFGLPAAVGVQLAEQSRRVVAIIGDGSANYALPALWTAAQHRIPVVVVILKNGSYAALRAFAGAMKVKDAPGLDLPAMDFCALASGYGVRALAVSSAEELASALADGLAGDEPLLIEVETESINPFD